MSVRKDEVTVSTGEQRKNAIGIIAVRAVGTLIVLFLLAIGGAAAAIALDSRWRTEDPDGLAPVLMAATVMSLVAAIRVAWRPMISAAWGGAVATVAWVTAVMQNSGTGAEAHNRATSWALATIFMSVSWVLIFRPIGNQELARTREIERIRERDEITSVLVREVTAAVRTELTELGHTGDSSTGAPGDCR